MPTPYTGHLSAQDGQEKSPLAGQPGPVANAGRKPYGLLTEGAFSSGWTGSRLADCFASFSMCPPCSTFEPQTGTSAMPRDLPRQFARTRLLTSSPEYQPLPTTASYDYGDGRPMLDAALVSIQPQSQPSLVPTPVTPDPTAMFPCDDPGLMARYFPSYPPLQPVRVTGFQPATSREEMVYPGNSPIAKYDNHTDNPHGAPVLGIQGQHYLVDSSRQTATMPLAYGAGEPSSYDGHGSFMNLASPCNLIHGLDTKQGVENLGVPDGSAVLDLFPPHKTTPVKRGPFKDQDQREKTALTRKMGSCIRCRMQRIRVRARRPSQRLAWLLILTFCHSVISIQRTKRARVYHARRSPRALGCIDSTAYAGRSRT